MLTLKNLGLNRIVQIPQAFRSRLKTVDNVAPLGSDRRISPRIKSYNLLKYSYQSGAQNEWISNLKDISEGGVQFNSRGMLQKDAVLKLLINVAEANRQIEVMAKTVWTQCEKARGTIIHHVGATFLNINERDRMMIRDLSLAYS